MSLFPAPPDTIMPTVENTIISGNINDIGLRPIPETNINTTMPTTATTMINGMSARISGTGCGSGASGGASGAIVPVIGCGPAFRVAEIPARALVTKIPPLCVAPCVHSTAKSPDQSVCT